jgi:hypothetical protein
MQLLKIGGVHSHAPKVSKGPLPMCYKHSRIFESCRIFGAMFFTLGFYFLDVTRTSQCRVLQSGCRSILTGNIRHQLLQAAQRT